MKRLVMATAVFATLPLTAPSGPSPTRQDQQKEPMRQDQPKDPRLAQLRQFFADGDCPVGELAEDFLREADVYDLDWRLLPSISVVESGGGKDFRNNNIFGWDSGNAFFPSVQAGIHIVADRLATSRLYRDKEVDEILRIYNPNPDYAARVKSVMMRLSPEEDSLD